MGSNSAANFSMDTTVTYRETSNGKLSDNRIYSTSTQINGNASEETVYEYDSNGSILGMQYHAASYAEDVWDTYWYEKNIFGDIVAIYGEDGTKILSYFYNAYGRTLYTRYVDEGYEVNNLNPFLYRGYYYDSDIGLYYLQTRYYDPVKCRFISPDEPSYLGANGDLLSYNLYAYCSNNPVMYVDPTGQFVISTMIVGALIGATISFGSSVVSQSLTGDKSIHWGQVALDTIIGGINGALGTSGINQAISIAAGGVLGAVGSVGGDLIASKGDWGAVNVWKAVVMGGVGALSGKWTGAGTQNSKAMIQAINSGNSWGSKAFLNSVKEVALRPDSGLTLQTMYINLARAISRYTLHGITKVSFATLGSTSLGYIIGG